MATSTIKQTADVKLITSAVSDANTANTSKAPLLFKANASTSNTPYSQGISTAGDAYILDLQGDMSYNTQYAFCVADGNIYTRVKIPNGWTNWARKTS